MELRNKPQILWACKTWPFLLLLSANGLRGIFALCCWEFPIAINLDPVLEG